MIIFYIAMTILVIGIIILICFSVHISKTNKRKNDILKLFMTACQKKEITKYTLQYLKKADYDVYFESEKSIYYVKVILNPSSQEICINNAVQWQVRKLNDPNGHIVFVEKIESLMRLDLKNKEKKEHKLFIIYPNTRALLKVINECEMVFVYPDTDVYGASVVTYHNLAENLDLLDV